MKVVMETERLLLRHFTEADAEALLHMESEPDVLRYVGRKPLADVAAYRNKIRSTFLPYYDKPGGHGAWAIIEKMSDEFVGGCSLRPGTDSNFAAEMGLGPDDAEMGYGLRKPSWGRGYATELAQALVRRAFTELGAASVVACVTVDNFASVRVLEKAGLRRFGEPICLPGEDELSVKYGLTKEAVHYGDKHRHAAGIDIHVAEHFVAVPPEDVPAGFVNRDRKLPVGVRKFGTNTADLEAIADWLKTDTIDYWGPA